MKTLYKSLLLALPVMFLAACGNNTENTAKEQAELAKEQTAEEINREIKTTQEGEQDAEFVVQAYRYNLALQQFSEVAKTKQTSEPIRKFAEESASYHQELNSDLQQAANTLNIVLPTDTTNDVLETREALMASEGKEFAEEYIEEVSEVQQKLILSYQKALLNVTDPKLHDWVKVSSVKLSEHEEMVRQLEEVTK